MRLVWAYILMLLFFSCKEHQTIQPNQSEILQTEWIFKQEGKQEMFPAKVPGLVHLDLFENKLIDDPFWEDNELKQRWIENENWVYSSFIEASDSLLQNEHIELQFDGLDTYAKVYINEELVLTADNMFRTWKVDLKSFLNKGRNDIDVHFKSPIKHNKSIVENYQHQLPSGNETANIETKVSSFTRKAAYHFGWDWGPRFVTTGIWRSVHLNTWNKARIVNVYTTTQNLSKDKAEMNTQVEVEVSEAGEYQLFIDGVEQTHQFNAGTNYVNYSFSQKSPRLWESNGRGEANLYVQNVMLKQNDQLIQEEENTYGIRTIELVNEPDSIGTSFYFKLNGEPVFMQGANYIPQDVFLPRVEPEQYERLLQQVKDANMNMIRVWGGGIYENDLFYDLCDQYGILVWQDFMFAGSLYPDDEAFRANIKQEVRDNIKRLRQHPCLALWCGNNEIEVAWKNWGWQKQYGYSQQDSTKIWQNYQSIFHELIPQQLVELDPQRNYTSTSPLSNWGAAENFNHSSMHYWGVWHGREPFENFENNVGRFMVEYGFQSFPDLSSLQQVISEENLHLDSDIMKLRQKSYIGNGLIMQHINQYLTKPILKFEEFINRSQETQARGIQMAIKAHKSKQPHCMGTLFWQLNDCWPGPSWSIIDYYGKPKEAYKGVKAEFSKD